MVNSSYGSWKRWRWVDSQRSVIWFSPIGAVIVFFGGVMAPIGPYHNYVVLHHHEKSVFKEIFYIAFFFFLFLGGLYYFFGICKMFFIELRQKFIAYEVCYYLDVYRLKGYFFKKDRFNPSEVTLVEEYYTDMRFGKDIATALSWLPGKPNYKITLKDGRIFYLPGHMEELESLKSQLQDDILHNI